MNKFYLSFLLILSVLISCNTSSPKKESLSNEDIMRSASRTEKNGWILIHLEGTPDVIGYQHGYLLADEIINLRGAMAMLNDNTTGKNWDFYRNESYRLLWSKIPAEYQQEITGISAGVNAKLGEGKIDIKDLVAINSFLEMTGYYVPWLNQEKNPSPPEHCSAFAATGSWTSDGKIVIAHCFDNGKETSFQIIETTGKPASIRLVADRYDIKADGNDLSYVRAEILDSNGNIVPDADDILVNFDVTGNGKVAGVGSGNPRDMSNFQQPKKKAYQGICLAIIRPETAPGNIYVKATAAGLKEANVVINTK